jgi:signal transduction histidine kinase
MNSIATYTAIALDNAYAYETINKAHKELKDAQTQLIQAEKMASLGQLTAGIAHEIKNPLNFVNNFAELSIDLAKELKQEVDSQKELLKPGSAPYIDEMLNDLEHNVIKINEHGKRADSIVRGMLLHSRGKAGELQKTDINALLQEYINLAYHGFRAQDSSFNVKLETQFDQTVGLIYVIPQDISRVFLNIINNACYSVHEKRKEKGERFFPVVSVCTKNVNNKIEIIIRDNGKGIPSEVLEKIFNPFFTTKPAGKGTGLGLSLSYDIVVQAHKGELKVDSQEGEYAEFLIRLPKDLA